jgi:restriction system protein
MTNSVNVPTYDAMMNPVLQALQELGGSATIEEINSKVAEICKLEDDQLQLPHARGRRSEVEYRLAWTRTYLKAYGVIQNSSRGVWSLTVEGRRVREVDPRAVVRAMAATQRKSRALDPSVDVGSIPLEEAETWREQLLDFVMALQPPAFERLCQRILRESGFIQV